VVQSFIDTAGPVGSRYLAKHYPLGLSAASIRNTMSDLEELGYLDHPYTSAGRVPTELGYRAFVDKLMDSPGLDTSEKKVLKAELERLMGQTEMLLRESSQILGRLTNLLGIVLTPRMATGVLERLDIVPLSSTRAMVVISVRGGLIRTIVVEIASDLKRGDLDRVLSILNERLSGLTLQEIRRTFQARTRDVIDDQTGLVQLLLQTSALVFSEEPGLHRVQFGSTQSLLRQPEFQEPIQLHNLMALLEDEEAVVQLLEEPLNEAVDRLGEATISIGSENNSERVARYSVVTAQYTMGNMKGTIGVLGPTRMDYQRVVALVEALAALLSGPADDA
jgi:heat-inducible transcriptional repressor